MARSHGVAHTMDSTDVGSPVWKTGGGRESKES